MIYVETERLILRSWQDRDLDAYTAINTDPEVMEFFPKTYDRIESKALMDKCNLKTDQNGFSFWAAELKVTGELIGQIGISIPDPELPFGPCVEVGWRLAKKFWGQGLAQEGARGSLKFGFEQKNLNEIVALTTVHNVKSRRVMERIGMKYDPTADFKHPKIAPDHPLALHVLYRIKNAPPYEKSPGTF